MYVWHMVWCGWRGMVHGTVWDGLRGRASYGNDKMTNQEKENMTANQKTAQAKRTNHPRTLLKQPQQRDATPSKRFVV